jgi:hypothetical protein
MFSTRKYATFFLGISAVSMSLLTVSLPTSAADGWPWDVAPSQHSVADGWPWDRSVPAGWPWDGVKSPQNVDEPSDKSADGASGSATLV